MGSQADDKELQSAIREDLHLVAYDNSWPQKFINEKNRLLSIFAADIVALEHIGSTAIPGLDAKPILDMMAAVKSMKVAEKLLQPLREFGYVTPDDCNANLPDRRWLMRHHGGHRTFHLHLVEIASEGWRRTLRFRDALRSDVKLAQSYKELKLRLIDSDGSDRDKYIRGKTAFIEATLKKFS